jgi:hypothetical protein
MRNYHKWAVTWGQEARPQPGSEIPVARVHPITQPRKGVPGRLKKLVCQAPELTRNWRRHMIRAVINHELAVMFTCFLGEGPPEGSRAHYVGGEEGTILVFRKGFRLKHRVVWVAHVSRGGDSPWASATRSYCGYHSRRANVKRLLPEAIVTHCLPSTRYVIGPAMISPPRFCFHSSAPERASRDWK